MKTTIFLLKTFCLLFGFTFCASLTYADGPRAKNKKTKATTEQTQKEITAYFTNYLSGKGNAYTTGNPLKLSDIRNEQQLVWDAWVAANKNYTEEKLPALEKLSLGKAGKWNLPENLEPNAIMNFYWGSKGEAKPEKGYPLYLYTHGSGHKDAEWATGLQICQMFDDAPCAYFIPQIPNMGEYYRWWHKSKQYAWEKLLRQAFVSGNINPDKVYFFGISEGGYGSQRLASFYADYLAGAGPMAGGEPLKNAPAENCRNIAFSLLTGANDQGFYRNKLTQYVKTEFDRLQQKYPESFIHRIELIPGRQHAIDYRPTTPWLKQYTRNPYPKYVNWENFEMDGLYRKGFYNLYVKERSTDNNDSRTYYEMTIQNNEITLNVNEVNYKTVETDPYWGIQLKFEKSYKPAKKGKVVIYLCNELVDLSQKITVTVNGKKAFNGIVKPDLKHLVNSCATFFDPARLYPAAIEVDIEKLANL